MSSTEQAPEPTMDEILASIRRIIADDDGAGAQRPQPRGAEAAAPDRPPETEARSRESAAARETQAMPEALRQAERDPRPAPPAESEDDILDLTSEMFSANEDLAVPEPAAPRSSAASSFAPNPAQRSAGARESAVRPPHFGDDFAGVRASADHTRPDFDGDQDFGEAAMARTPSPAIDAQPPAARPERPAMAALRDTAKRPEPAPMPAESATAVRQAEPAPAIAPPAPADGSDAKSGAETVRGSASLEECVRELLRPMLREWVDQNLPRILEDAVRRELAAQVRDRQRGR